MTTYRIMPVAQHEALVRAAYAKRGFSADECQAGASFSTLASWHGIRTHNAIKALHLDELFGSPKGGCIPGAKIEKLPSKFEAFEKWNANKKLGQAVGFAAMQRCMELADRYGVGAVTVDNAFHYLWGGGYVIDAAKKGYIAYTCCTSTLAEVVPFGGKVPTMGTNPHSWGFPTQDILGFPICIDWATSAVAMGRVQQFAREGKQLPPGCALDKDGNPTTDPNKVLSLLPFGQHKGYGLMLIDELVGAYTGGSLPRLRGRAGTGGPNEKHSAVFFFQCMRADAFDCGNYAQGRDQKANVKAVLDDILCEGNRQCMLPGQPEAESAKLSEKHGGLLFTAAEIEQFAHLAVEAGVPFDVAALATVEA